MEFEVVRNDIVNMKVDAVVLPANPRLMEGRGASRAIYEKAGKKDLTDACKKARRIYGKIQVGNAIPTLGFGLEASIIIHAVVPKWKDGRHGEYAMLSAAYLASLDLSDAMDCESIAFPLLSSGNNGFDLNLAFDIAAKSMEAFEPKNRLEKVYLVVYDAYSMAFMRKRGINVTELIDSEYELRHEVYNINPLWDKVDEAKAWVTEQLEQPEVREKMLEWGEIIAKSILSK